MPSPLQGFNQIVAVTQNHINAGLDTRFQLVPELGYLNVAGQWGKINAVMSPGTVYLYTPHEPFKTRFCVNLSSGKCEWYSLDISTSPPTVKIHEADIKDWTLAFTVNLSLEAISNIPEEIKDKITFPGSYSLSQLLLNFTTANLSSFDPDLTNTPGIGNESDPNRKVAFEYFIKTYLKTLAEKGYNFLGYAITVPDPAVANPKAPSFPPVSVQFQMMEHRNASGIPDVPGLNCFLFLEMTSKDRTPPQMISWTKNWVEQGKSGSMVISKANFWDHFFIIRSKFLNRMALKMLNRLAYALDKTDVEDPPWGIGQEPSDSDLGWKSTTAQSMSYSWKHDVPVYDVSQFYSWGHTCEITVDVTLNTSNNVITVKAWSHVWRKEIYISYGGGGHVIKKEHVVDAKIDWGYSFTLNSIADGTLDMSATLDSPKCTCWVENTSNIGNHWQPSNNELSTWATEDLQGRVDKNKNTLLTDVKEALKTHSQFVFPGGGTFFMKDPQYNNDGDLMVNLQYKQE